MILGNRKFSKVKTRSLKFKYRVEVKTRACRSGCLVDWLVSASNYNEALEKAKDALLRDYPSGEILSVELHHCSLV